MSPFYSFILAVSLTWNAILLSFSPYFNSQEKPVYLSRTPESLLWITATFIEAPQHLKLRFDFVLCFHRFLLSQLTAQLWTCSSRRSQHINYSDLRSSRGTVSWYSLRLQISSISLLLCCSFSSLILSIFSVLPSSYSNLKQNPFSSASLACQKS